MQGLVELLGSVEGRGFLEARGVFTDTQAFVNRLRPPADESMSGLLGLERGSLPVYLAQQAQADYGPSIVCKFQAGRDLAGVHAVAPVGIWQDMDRTGAHKEQTTLTWPGAGGEGSIRLAPQRFKHLETRFVPVEPSRLEAAAAALEAWASSLEEGDEALVRAARLADLLRGTEHRTLSRVNHAIASHLLREHLGFEPPDIFVSELASGGLITGAVDAVVSTIDDVVSVYNLAIEALAAAGVDPVVRPLGPGYLPLHYSCPKDGTRCRLVHERAGPDHFAVTECRCGTAYRFHLGGASLSIEELAATGRWSPDVTLPIYLNDLASGLVAGRSSALYGLVLGEVLQRVLGARPVPMLVPDGLLRMLSGGDPAHSLLHAYLTGG